MTKRFPIKVSDHAVVRYLERVEGFDVDAVRLAIAQKVHLAARHDTACGVIVGGFRYRISNRVVTTIIPASQRDIRTGGRGK